MIGRPPIEFDMKLVEECGERGESYEEMADRFECSLTSIHRHMTGGDEPFRKAYKRGNARMTRLLRSTLIRMALGNPKADPPIPPDRVMGIWVSKQVLGWMEPSDRLKSEEIKKLEARLEALEKPVPVNQPELEHITKTEKSQPSEGNENGS